MVVEPAAFKGVANDSVDMSNTPRLHRLRPSVHIRENDYSPPRRRDNLLRLLPIVCGDEFERMRGVTRRFVIFHSLHDDDMQTPHYGSRRSCGRDGKVNARHSSTVQSGY